MKAVTRNIGENLFESEINGIKLKLDTGSAEKSNQSPVEAVLSALASCSSIDVLDIIKKKRKTVIDLTVESEGQRRQEPFPRIFEHIHLHFKLTSPDTEMNDLEQAVKLSMDKYCSVAGMINSTCKIEYSWEIIR
jgi:putative redox protein